MPSALRVVLRSRLTAAMRERDRAAVSVLRTAVAAIENAEAVPTDEGAAVTTSADVAGAAIGLGVTEGERRPLDDPAERSIVLAEVRSLTEAEVAFAAAGRTEQARDAALGAALLSDVLDEVAGHRR
jgi:uncharacterized protein